MENETDNPGPHPDCEDHGPHGPHSFYVKRDLWNYHCPGSGPAILHRKSFMPMTVVSTPHDQFAGERHNTNPQWWTKTDDGTKPLKPSDTIVAWLDKKHTTLWSTFNIGPEGDSLKAAEWFLDELTSFTRFVESRNAQFLEETK